MYKWILTIIAYCPYDILTVNVTDVPCLVSNFSPADQGCYAHLGRTMCVYPFIQCGCLFPIFLATLQEIAVTMICHLNFFSSLPTETGYCVNWQYMYSHRS